jgi:hypothetical protein
MRRIILPSVACYRSSLLFPHYLINGKIFVKKVTDQKCVFWLSLKLLPETFIILRRTEREIIINVKYPILFQILVKLQSFRQSFEKKSYIKFHENPSGGSRAVPCWQKVKRTWRWQLHFGIEENRLKLGHSSCCKGGKFSVYSADIQSTQKWALLSQRGLFEF